jgi:hypothetical protein
MVRSIAAFAVVALLAGGALAKGGGGGYRTIYVPGTSVAPAQPGNACIADGVGSGQETRTSDGKLVLAQGVHGANTIRCPNPLFPNLATTQKLASDEVRNVPSTRCVPLGSKVGDEVTIPYYGRATVLELHSANTECSTSVEATVISTVAYRASKNAQALKPTASQPYEPTEAEIRKEYDRLFAAAAPVKEFHVRHILVRKREDALSVIQRIKSGKSFADVAAEVSIDPGSRSKGGDLGWNVPSSFIEEFSKSVVSLAPAGLAVEPTHTRFGWHVIEVLETKTGKDSFPAFSVVKNRIAANLKITNAATAPVGAKAVCRKMVAPELPDAVLREGTKGTVVVKMRVEDGKVTKILSLSGPSIFHPAVIKAVKKYECDRLDRAVIATQSFDF